MERLTKAAIATGGAAALLLGGAGTLAYWTAEGTATGTDVSSGSLTVTDGACGEWAYAPEDGGGPVTEGIVPGDVVVSDCTLTVTGDGDHLGIDDVAVTAPTWAAENGLTAELTLGVGEAELDGAVVPETGVAVTGTHTLTVEATATFTGATATNASQNLTAALEDVTVTVTQTHIPEPGA